MLKRTLLASAALLSVSANAYMFEGTYSYYDASQENEANGRSLNNDTDTTGHEVELNVYLEDVDVSKGAWDEAAFLNQSSFVSGSFLGLEQKPSIVDQEADEKVEIFTVGGRSVINGLIIQGAISTTKFRASDGQARGQESSFGFGGYFGENHSLTGDISFIGGQLADFYPIGSMDDAYTYRLGLNYHGYFPIGDSKQSMSLDANVYGQSTSFDDLDADGSGSGLSAVFTYFPFPQLGVGADLETAVTNLNASGDNDLDITNTSFDVFVHWYPVEQFRFGGGVGAVSTEFDDGDTKLESDGAEFFVDLRIRF
ncbi:Uncharacterised protein [BD1-7 clade bacterium]|uniref:Porin domain-containing protein n=1 Tax=BD1-7 clade bacterium TaxID=2029982 RepID=A0A5S9PGD3_9GAMM|nr:Uncharacterised protein [BD1-7 clade bacterium]